MSFITTMTGKKFDFNDLQMDNISIRDIAHALSNLCRFNGHTKVFYSVAQHSAIVAAGVPEEFALAALLHDAAEAYVGDTPTPLKTFAPGLLDLELKIQAMVNEKFGCQVTANIKKLIKTADLILLATEKRDLVTKEGSSWNQLEGIDPLDNTITAMHPGAAYSRFMYLFRKYGGQDV